MLGMVAQVPGVFISVFVCTLLVARYLTRRVMVSDFDSFGMVNFTVALSLGLVASLYSLGVIELRGLMQASILTLAFYIGSSLTSWILGAGSNEIKRRRELEEMFFRDNVGELTVTITAIVLIGLSLFFGSMLFQGGASAAERVLLAKAHRAVDMVRRGAGVIFPYYSIGLYMVKRKKRFAIVAMVTAMVGVVMGGRGFLISYLVAYFTIKGILDGKRSVWWHLSRAWFPVAAVFGGASVESLWGEEWQTGLLKIVERVVATGDIYYYAYAIGDYRQLYEDYGFFSYVLHPLTAVVGVRGYEWPIGAAILETAGLNVEGFGPNPHLPVVLLVLVRGKVELAVLAAMAVGAWVSVSRVYALRCLEIRELPALWRLGIFAVLFGSAPVLFVDIGAFEFDLIAAALIVLALSLAYELMGIRYKRRLLAGATGA